MHVIVPVKRFDQAKQRLASACTAAERVRLARAMAVHVLGQLQELRTLDGVVIVSNEPEMPALADNFGMKLVADDGGGLNAAISEACQTVPGGRPVGVVHADLPLFRAAPFGQLVDQHHRSRSDITIVTDVAGTGTNVLLSRRSEAMKPCFGPNSAERHREAGFAAGLTVRTLRCWSLSHDCDTPDDLLALRPLIDRGMPLTCAFDTLTIQPEQPAGTAAREG